MKHEEKRREEKRRDSLLTYRSAIMGIAIIWIMLFHSGIPAPENMVLRALWYLFVSFGGGMGVDIFLILSGLGLFLSAAKKEKAEPVLSFYKRRFLRILPAYLLISIAYYAVKQTDFLTAALNISFVTFFLEGVRDFWYIALILFLYLLFPLYDRLCRRFGSLLVFIAAIVLALFVDFIVCYLFPDVYINIEVFLTRVPCFFVGCEIASLIYSDQKHRYKAIIIICVAILAFLCSFVLFQISSLDNRMLRYLFIPASVLAILVFAFVLQFLPKLFSTVLGYFGTRSLEIYLVHVSLGGWISGMIDHFYISLMTFVCVSLLLSEAVYQLTNKRSFTRQKIALIMKKRKT